MGKIHFHKKYFINNLWDKILSETLMYEWLYAIQSFSCLKHAQATLDKASLIKILIKSKNTTNSSRKVFSSLSYEKRLFEMLTPLSSEHFGYSHLSPYLCEHNLFCEPWPFKRQKIVSRKKNHSRKFFVLNWIFCFWFAIYFVQNLIY